MHVITSLRLQKEIDLKEHQKVYILSLHLQKEIDLKTNKTSKPVK